MDDRETARWVRQMERHPLPRIEPEGDDRPTDAELARMTVAALRALALEHAAEEPAPSKANPSIWPTWAAEFDRLALALADALRRAG